MQLPKIGINGSRLLNTSFMHIFFYPKKLYLYFTAEIFFSSMEKSDVITFLKDLKTNLAFLLLMDIKPNKDIRLGFASSFVIPKFGT